MTHQRKLLGLFAMGGLAAIISCDSSPSPSQSGLASNDCPYGTFRPQGISDCVFPATDVNGNSFGVADDRCAQGQPAIPPSCVSDSGLRPYLWATGTCASGYRFEPGACNRTGGMAGFAVGTAGSVGTGSAGFFGTGAAGVIGTAGTAAAGFAGTTTDTGAAGDFGFGGAGGAAGFGEGTGAAGATDTDGGVDSPGAAGS
jgi:hypothetical protein